MISIIIPVYNKIELIQHCIEKNIVNCSHPCEWIIIDNDSDEATQKGLLELKKAAEERSHVFIVVRETENTGTARAWNTGLKKASGDIVVILNNDCMLMPGWDDLCKAEMNKNQLDIFTPFIIEPHMLKNYNENIFWEGEQNWNYYLKKNRGRICKGIFGGVVFMARKEVYAQIGPFDPKFWLSLDDMDYIYRALTMGLRAGITGNMIGFHLGSATRKEMNVNEQTANDYFEQKWGWNFSKQEHTFFNKLIRSYNKRKFRYWGLMSRWNMIVK